MQRQGEEIFDEIKYNLNVVCLFVRSAQIVPDKWMKIIKSCQAD